MANAYLGNYRDMIREHAAVPDVVVELHLDAALNHLAASRWGTNTYTTAVVYYAAHYVEIGLGNASDSPLVLANGDTFDQTRWGKLYRMLLGMQVTELFSGLV